MKIQTKNKIIDGIIALFILLFLYTAITKILTYQAFVNTLKLFPLVDDFPTLAAILVIVSEFLAVVLLFVPSFQRSGLFLSLGLMTLFTGYIAYALLSGSKLPCTCGGVLQQLTWPQHLIFNLFFIVIAAIAIWLLRDPQLLISRRSRKPVEKSRRDLLI